MPTQASILSHLQDLNPLARQALKRRELEKPAGNIVRMSGENIASHYTIWPTPVINEGDTLAFDILAVASPDPGSDVTVVIQT